MQNTMDNICKNSHEVRMKMTIHWIQCSFWQKEFCERWPILHVSSCDKFYSCRLLGALPGGSVMKQVWQKPNRNQLTQIHLENGPWKQRCHLVKMI